MVDVGKKSPPFSYEAEIGVLGAMLLTAKARDIAIDELQDTDFYEQKHLQLFQLLEEKHNNDEPIDLLTISETAKKRSLQLSRVDIAKISRNVATSSNILEYCLLVKQFSISRQILNGAGEVINQIYNGKGEFIKAFELLKDTYETIESKLEKNEVETEQTLVNRTVKGIEDIYNGVTPKLDFPIDSLNKVLSFYQKEYMVIGARSSVGKTAMALTLAEYWASLGFKVLFLSAEMGSEAMTKRRLSFHSGFTFKELENDMYKLKQAKEILERKLKGNLFIDDRSDLSARNLKARVKQAIRKDGIQIFIGDHAQLIIGHGKERRNEVDSISKAFKTTAKETNTWGVLLSQVGRESVKAKRRPIKEDLKESGSLEEDADVVLLLDRPVTWSYEKDWDVDGEKVPINTVGTIEIGKQRNGALTLVYSCYRGNRMKWDNWKGNSF
ncbi:MAG: replicative DNA helicase [Chlorobiota bacterium]